MVEDTTLYQQLHKLSGIKSEEALHHLLSTLWNSRRTGLRPPEKSHLHSLLNLPSLPELDPLLACLRSLIRKCAHDNVTGDELLKLFPPDLPIDLQTTLVLSFQKFHNQWKQDLSTQQDPLPRNNGVSYQGRTSVPPPPFACLPSSEISTTSTVTSLWPRQDAPVARLNRDDLGALAPLVVDTNASATLLDNLGTLPRLKSMTWTMQNCSSGLNLADYDAPTQALKPELRNSRYVDAVLTVPVRAMLPLSGINIAFDRELVGPALIPALKLAGEGKFRWETMEDIWSGMCVKVISDHMGLGVKSGLPYVWRNERGNAIESLKKEWEGVKLMEEVVPFFQAVRLPQSAVTAEDCVVELAKTVKEQLGQSYPMFVRAAEAMVEWIKVWKAVRSG